MAALAVVESVAGEFDVVESSAAEVHAVKSDISDSNVVIQLRLRDCVIGYCGVRRCGVR